MTQTFTVQDYRADPKGMYLCDRQGCDKRAHRYGICKDHFVETTLKMAVQVGVVECVYAVLAPALNAVKIGVSKSPESRLSGLVTGSPVEVELLGAVPGSRAIEQVLHKLLKPYAMKGEWFRYEGDAKRVADAIATDDLTQFEACLDSL